MGEDTGPFREFSYKTNDSIEFEALDENSEYLTVESETQTEVEQTDRKIANPVSSTKELKGTAQPGQVWSNGAPMLSSSESKESKEPKESKESKKKSKRNSGKKFATKKLSPLDVPGAMELLAQLEAPTPAEPPKSIIIPKPTELPVEPAKPIELAKPIDSPKPVESAKPIELPKPRQVSKPLEVPKLIEIPKPVELPKPSSIIAQGNIPAPGNQQTVATSEVAATPAIATGKVSRKEPEVIDPPSSEAEIIDDFNDTLAEECFNEANRLLAAKDRAGAIAQYREALGFAPHHTEKSLKLADVLAMEVATREDAEQVLARAAELAPNNKTVRAKLKDLRKLIENSRPDTPPAKRADSETATPKKGVDNRAAKETEAKNDEEHQIKAEIEQATVEPAAATKGVCSSCGLVNPPSESSCRRCFTPLKGKAKGRYGQAITSLPSRISTLNLVVLVLFAVAVIASLGISHKEARIETEPISPKDSSAITAANPEFTWSCNAESVHFLFQIEENGEKIIEHYTKETTYTLSPEDYSKIKIGHFYKWRALPISPKDSKLPYTSKDTEFRILKEPVKPVPGQQ